jgi:hypothetical protein
VNDFHFISFFAVCFCSNHKIHHTADKVMVNRICKCKIRYIKIKQINVATNNRRCILSVFAKCKYLYVYDYAIYKVLDYWCAGRSIRRIHTRTHTQAQTNNNIKEIYIEACPPTTASLCVIVYCDKPLLIVPLHLIDLYILAMTIRGKPENISESARVCVCVCVYKHIYATHTQCLYNIYKYVTHQNVLHYPFLVKEQENKTKKTDK